MTFHYGLTIVNVERSKYSDAFVYLRIDNLAQDVPDLGGITIEDNVLIAPKVSLLSEGHPVSPQSRQSLVPGRIHIKKNTWIGAGATILPGVTIGKNAVVAAGAVVSKDVAANTIVGGIPAKIIKAIN